MLRTRLFFRFLGHGPINGRIVLRDDGPQSEQARTLDVLDALKIVNKMKYFKSSKNNIITKNTKKC